MRGGGRLCAEADADGAENTGVDRESGRLPWREEKRLGFRAACLRDWLLDAVRYGSPLLRCAELLAVKGKPCIKWASLLFLS